MRGGPSKQPTSATNKGGPPARTIPASNTTTQAPKTNDPRHIPR
jgi:hypothetical protein